MKTVIIIDTYLLGDQVFAGSFVRHLIREGRYEQIYWVTSTKSATLARHLAPEVEVVALEVPWTEAGWYWRPWRLIRAIRSIWRLPVRAGGCIGVSARGGWLQRIVAHRLGVHNLLEGDAVPSDWKSRFSGGYRRSVANVYDGILARLSGGNDSLGKAIMWPYLNMPPVSVALGETPLILLGPEASLKLKEWPRENWGRLYRELTRRGFRCVFLLHQTTVSDYDVVAPFFKGNFADLSAQLGRTDLFVGLDSFAGHFAAAHGVPVALLYSTGASSIWSHPRTLSQVIVDPVAESGVVFSRKTQHSAGLAKLSVEELLSRLSPLLDNLKKSDEPR